MWCVSVCVCVVCLCAYVLVWCAHVCIWLVCTWCVVCLGVRGVCVYVRVRARVCMCRRTYLEGFLAAVVATDGAGCGDAGCDADVDDDGENSVVRE